jgi:uncharacterized sulfatase
MKRPNILLITSDQQRWDHLGLAGLDGIETPNLDRLGREGVHFCRAYTPSPVCTPARVSLMTGNYPSIHRAYSIGVTVDPFPRPTVPDLLQAAGYDTALFGKAHFSRQPDVESHFLTDGDLRSADAPGARGGGQSPDSDWYREHDGPYLGFRVARLASAHTTNGTPVLHYRTWLEDQGLTANDWAEWFPDVTGRHDHGATGAWSIPAEYHDTTFVTALTEQWIRDHARDGDDDSPWFCWASYQDPHEPFVCPEPWYSRVNTSRMQLQEGYRPGELDDRPRFYREARDVEFGPTSRHGGGVPGTDWASFDDGNGIPCAYRRDDLEGRESEAMRATLGMVGFLDHGVGKILAALEAASELENTVIIYTSDHGELHGHHGFWHKGLFAYEDVQRVPLLVWGPGRVRARGTIPALANLVDLPRTILGAAGVDIPVGMQGVDLTPILTGERDRVREATIVELEATRNVYQQTLVTARYKLVVYRDSDEGELYDVEADPDQYTNLWSDTEHASTRTALLLELAREQMRREGRAPERESFA